MGPYRSPTGAAPDTVVICRPRRGYRPYVRTLRRGPGSTSQRPGLHRPCCQTTPALVVRARHPRSAKTRLRARRPCTAAAAAANQAQPPSASALKPSSRLAAVVKKPEQPSGPPFRDSHHRCRRSGKEKKKVQPAGRKKAKGRQRLIRVKKRPPTDQTLSETMTSSFVIAISAKRQKGWHGVGWQACQTALCRTTGLEQYRKKVPWSMWIRFLTSKSSGHGIIQCFRSL